MVDLPALRFCGMSPLPAHPELDLGKIDIARRETDLVRYEIYLARCDVPSGRLLIAKPESRWLCIVGRREALSLPSGVGLCT